MAQLPILFLQTRLLPFFQGLSPQYTELWATPIAPHVATKYCQSCEPSQKQENARGLPHWLSQQQCWPSAGAIHSFSNIPTAWPAWAHVETMHPSHIYIFTSAHLHLHICTSTSSHLHIWTSTSLLIFTFSDLHVYRSSRSSFNSLLRPGVVPAAHHESQPSMGIVRVEGAKCRWDDCVLQVSRATLCGDRACRRREMQVRLRLVGVAGNPLRRSCVSKARNAGEIAFWICRARPSAEIVRVEGAKCRWDCVLDLARATLCGDRACRGREMQVRLRSRIGADNHLRRSCVSKARNAGEITKIVCLERCLLEWLIFIIFVAPRAGKILRFWECLVWNARFGSFDSHFLGMSRAKRSFWKSKSSFFANVSCETLVLQVQSLTFCECLVWNAGFASSKSHFLRMSRVKRLFWRSTFSLFANVSCETLVLEVYILTFCECLVWNARFGSLHSHFFANVSCETLVLEVYSFTFCECLVWNARFGSQHSHLFANVSCETLVLEVYILTVCECLVWNAVRNRDF